MKSIVITTLAIIVSSTSFSQVKGTFTPKDKKIVVGWDEKVLTISSDILSKDEYVVGDLKHAYFFNEKAELTETKDAEKGKRFYFNTYKEEDTTVNVLNDKAIVSIQGQSEKIIDFNESKNFSPRDNIINELVGYTGPVYISLYEDQDYFYNAAMYMSISESSHPNLNSLDGNVFHTFLRFVKIDRNLKTAEVKYGLIDKIKASRSDRNKANINILGFIKNKVIVQFYSYSLKESEKYKLHIEYWSYDLDTGEEVLLKEFDKTYQSEIDLMTITSSNIKNVSALNTISWLELDSVTNSNAIKFHVLGFNKELEFVDQLFDTPVSKLSTFSMKAPGAAACLGFNNEVFVYLDMRITLKRHVFQRTMLILNQSESEVNINYAPKLTQQTIKNMYNILSFKKWENEEIDNLFGLTKDELQFRLDKLKNYYFFSCSTKIIDGKLFIFKVKYTGKGDDEFLMPTSPSEIEIVEVE